MTVRRRLSLHHLSLAGLAAVLCSPVLPACPYSIRDAGFIVRDLSPYHLFIRLDDASPGAREAEAWVATAAKDRLADANVEAEVVNLQSDAHPGAEALAALEAGELPATVLITPGGGAITMPKSGQGGSLSAVEAAVEAAASSPLREELKRRVVDHWCVVVLAEGTDPAANGRARRDVEAAGRKIVGEVTEVGETIDTGPYPMPVPAGGAAESIMLSSLGLAEGPADEPRLAVVFGAGRRLGPVLRGAEISQQRVLEYLQVLGRSCTCTSDPSELLGPSLPLVWDADTRAAVREDLGFDPEKPEVRMVLAGVWSQEPGPSGGTGLGPQTTGYTEFPVEFAPEPTDDTPTRPAARLGMALIGAVLLLLVIAVVGGLAVVLRRARQRQ